MNEPEKFNGFYPEFSVCSKCEHLFKLKDLICWPKPYTQHVIGVYDEVAGTTTRVPTKVAVKDCAYYLEHVIAHDENKTSLDSM